MYVYALHCPKYEIGQGTAYDALIREYIETFFDKTDVIKDLKQPLSILQAIDC